MSAVAATPLERLRGWYAGLEPREQRIVLFGALGGALVLVIVLVLELHASVARAERRVAQKRADLAYVERVLPELRSAPVPQGGGESLVVVVDRTTRDGGLATHLRGTEPAGGNALRVRLEGAPFDATLNWLVRLQRDYGARVQAASLDKTVAPGHVDATVTLACP